MSTEGASSSSSNATNGTPSTQLVLVWDLDQTLIGIGDRDPSRYQKYFELNPLKPITMYNAKALEILYTAVKAREKGVVSAILLLTNNPSMPFVEYIAEQLHRFYNKIQTPVTRPIFDCIYIGDKIEGTNSYTHGREIQPPFNTGTGFMCTGNLRKGLEDVKNMLEEIGKPSDNLENRVFFFDDFPHHLMKDEIPKEHYIVIKPKYDEGKTDKTNFTLIQKLLNEGIRNASSSGGRRLTRGRRGRSRGRRSSRSSRSNRRRTSRR